MHDVISLCAGSSDASLCGKSGVFVWSLECQNSPVVCKFWNSHGRICTSILVSKQPKNRFMKQSKSCGGPSCLCSQGSLRTHLPTSEVPFDQNTCTDSAMRMALPRFT